MIITKQMLIEQVQGYLEEMAYPTDFDIPTFKNIRSFAGKLRYAQQKLLGKVGAGSGRAVFRIDQEKVLKVAMNQKGVDQNAEEAEGYKQNYDIIARVFEADDDDTWIEMELAKKVTPTRFKQLTGLTVDEVGAWLKYNREGDKGWVRIPDYIKKLSTDDNEFLYDLSYFTEDYQYPVPGDFARVSTYGEVLRNGAPKIVVIDFGFSSNVSDVYDQAKEKSFQKAQQKSYQYNMRDWGF